MPKVAHSLRVAASRESVWALVSNAQALTRWAYGARKVEFVTMEREGVGAEWRQTDVFGPLVIVRLYEVTLWNPPVALHVEAVSKPHVMLRYTLEDEPDAGGGAGTRVTLEMESDAPFAGPGRAAEPSLDASVGLAVVRRSVENLKRIAEPAQGLRGPSAHPDR